MTLATPFSSPIPSKCLARKPRTEGDVSALHDLAEVLDGRPLPGVRMTETQFHDWCDEDIRAEWIKGEVYLLAPPNIPHIRLNLWLCGLLESIVQLDKSGYVLIEAQVRLARLKERRNPDVVFVSRSRLQIIKQTYVDGAPDLIMEIVSPGSQARDWRYKYASYERAGVREYWVIDPQSEHVEAYALGKDAKFSVIREVDGKIKSKVMRPLYIRPSWLWQSPRPIYGVLLKELGIR